MQSILGIAQHIVQLMAKAVMARAYAVGPISPKQEADLRAFLTAEPSLYGKRAHSNH